MKSLPAAALLAVSFSAQAGDSPWLVESLGSHHFSDKHFNQHNYGAGIEYPTSVPSIHAVGGFYDNSFNRTSVYAGVTWLPASYHEVHAGLIGGAISGYTHPILPLVLPTIQFEHQRFGFNVYYAPKVKDGASVLGFQIKAAIQ